MVRWRRICSLVSLALGAALVPASACGPFLYDNADLDRFSFLDPGILNTGEWTNFLAFASPAFGQNSAEAEEQPVQLTIGTESSPSWAPGEDPLSVAANETWWSNYFEDVRGRKLAPADLEAVLYGPQRPRWLVSADREYLELLDGPADSEGSLVKALTEARNPKNPRLLRHRYAFWAVRALALGGRTAAYDLFREFSPGPATDLPLARAQGWAASVVAETDPRAARDLWVDLFVRWPDLRVQTFSSLSTLPAEAWDGARDAGALVARFFLDGRDFSPETLRAVTEADRAAGGNGSWSEAVFYAMAEQIEGEAGVFALFGLVDPHEVAPRGLFTGLIDAAQALVETGVRRPTRTWWLVASYLCLFDGDPGRAADLLGRARDLPARNGDQERQADLIGALVRMDAEKDRDWSPDLQNQVLSALEWGRSLDAPGHNRGLYHSVAVLAAQKYLARGHNPEAALTFGLVQSGQWGNPYRVEADDGFWTTGWLTNDPVNLLMDALMTDADIEAWRSLLKKASPEPLTAWVASRSFLSDRDLTWWEAHRALRRGEGPRALSLLSTLGPSAGPASAVFPDRRFSYSLDLDPLDPGSGRGMRTVDPQTLAALMVRIGSEKPLTQGIFWFSLQLSGMPLLFAQPPKVISFVGGNYEYYGYATGDSQRSTAVVSDFPLGRPSQSDVWADRLSGFYQNEFSTLGKARQAFQAAVARHDDPGSEFRALLFLQALDGDRYPDLADPRYASLPLAVTFRSTCEDFQGYLK